MEKARIIKGVGGLYSAELFSDGSIVDCRAKGSFRKDNTKPLPGDVVEIELQKDGGGFIVSICERKNFLIRPASANIDLVIFVVAAAKPDPDMFLLDKMTAVLTHKGIDILMLVNKSDVGDAEEICRIYRNSGIDAVPFSAQNISLHPDTISYVREKIHGKLCIFTGASGVGKSSAINAIFPELGGMLETGVLSKKIERGKHTTRKTELFRMGDETYIADTPGFSMLEIAKYNMIPKESLIEAFPDIYRHSLSCRYTDCRHMSEDGCGVLDALKKGEIERSRHESFKMLYEELKNKNEWDS